MVKIGTDLLSSLIPFVHITRSDSSSSLTKNRCERCFRLENDLKRCSRCQRIFYCSRSCQSADWSFHQYECLHLRELDDEIDLIRLVLRLIIRYDEQREKQGNSVGRKIDDLESHQNEIRIDRQRYRTYQKIIEQFNRWTNFESILKKFDESTLFLLFCRLVINTLTIHDPIDLKPIGYGLYLEATIYNHSCRPTCHTVFNGIELSIRTIIASPENLWTINYIDLLENFDVRQKILKENYYFQCQCSRCSTHEPKEDLLLVKIRAEEEKMDQAINTGQFARAFQSSEELVKFYDEILPHYHAYVALNAVKHLKLILYLAETMSPTRLQLTMNETSEHLRISMGDQHPLTQETQSLCEQYRLEMALHQEELRRLM